MFSAEQEADIAGESDVLGAVSPPNTTPFIQDALSTFQPLLNRNFFRLSAAETRSIGLSSARVGSSACLLYMSAGETLALLGTYALTVIRGAVSISGVTLYASRTVYPVYAPRSSPLPVIECLNATQDAQGDVIDIPARCSRSAGSAGTVLLLQSLQTGIEGLGHVCKTFDNSFSLTPAQKSQETECLGVAGIHFIVHRTHEICPFVVPPSWSATLSKTFRSISPANEGAIDHARQVYFVKGSKKSGKSAFARTLLNGLAMSYRKVAFLECDLGQSEFTPGGMVALNIVCEPFFGPPFTHPSIPYRAHYIGSTSPRSSPSHYLDAIQALMQTYNYDVQHSTNLDSDESEDRRSCSIVPLVVNMMGWNKGLGADLTSKIEDIVHPSHVFILNESAQEDLRTPDYRQALSFASSVPASSVPPEVSYLEPAPSAEISSRYSPADHRSLSILSYFYAAFPPVHRDFPEKLHSSYAFSWNTSLPLSARPAFEIAPRDALDQVVLAGAGSEDVVPSEILRVLNCAVVALVASDAGTTGGFESAGVTSNTAVPFVQGSGPPSPATSACHGLALIRSVSAESNGSGALLHLITPVPPLALAIAKPRILVKGEMELPIWGMLDFRTRGEVTDGEKLKGPYLRWGKGEELGGKRRRIRRNLMRRGLS